MKRLTIYLLTSLLVTCLLVVSVHGGAPAFPFKTYAEAGKLMTNPPQPVCDNGGSVIVIGQEWAIFTWVDRDLFIHYANEKPDYVFVTVGGPNGTIVVKAVLTIEQAKVRFHDSPCAYGDEKTI